MGISDLIASFLQESLEETDGGVLEVQRNDLALSLIHIFRQQLHTGDGQCPLALEQQKTQQSGAAAQVAHPKPRLQPGKAAQQKGVGTGLEQAVIADEGESAGAEEFPVLQVDPPIG